MVLFVGTIYSIGVLSGKGMIPPYKISRKILDIYYRYGPPPLDRKISKPIGELQISRDDETFVEIVKNKIKAVIKDPLFQRDRLKEATLITDYNFTYLESVEKENFFKEHLEGKSFLSPETIEVGRVTYYGMSHTGALIKTGKSPHKKLMVWIHGHEKYTFKQSYFSKIVDQAADTGFDVLSLSMTDYGFNENGTTTFPTHNGPLWFKNKPEKIRIERIKS